MSQARVADKPKPDSWAELSFLFEPGDRPHTGPSSFSHERSEFTYVSPAPELADFVEGYWFYECSDPSLRVRERVLPTGNLTFSFSLLDDSDEPTATGIFSKPKVSDDLRATSLIGATFKPGGAFPFLNCPVDELQNTDVSLDALWGKPAHHLREQMQETPSLAERFRILERSLLAQFGPPAPRHPAVSLALREFDLAPFSTTVRAITERTGLSSRKFVRLFTDEVGLTPKLYGRIRRFQEALWQVRRQWQPPCPPLAHSTKPIPGRVHAGSPQISWAELAMDCGYYDQSHLIHDFRSFCDMTPQAFLETWQNHINYCLLFTR